MDEWSRWLLLGEIKKCSIKTCFLRLLSNEDFKTLDFILELMIQNMTRGNLTRHMNHPLALAALLIAGE